MPDAPSPYRAVLGASLDGLSPELRAYFARIPQGHIGRGSGTFELVGTRRRWLWPMFAVLAHRGVIAPGLATDVPFTVANRPVPGESAVTAVREFGFAAGPWRMRDRIAVAAGELVDVLGEPALIRARLVGAVRADGALSLHSDRLWVLIRGRRVRVPNLLAPRIRLLERFDRELGRQHVSVRIEHAVIGVLYEYRGAFDYRVEAEPDADEEQA